MDRVARQVRVSDVALHPMHCQITVQRAAAADLDNITQSVSAARLSDNTPGNFLAPLLQRFNYLTGAVDRLAFLIGSNKKCDRSMQRLGASFFKEAFTCGDHGGETAFHISGPSAIKLAVANGWLKRRGMPLVLGATGNDIRVTGKAQHRPLSAIPSPEIVDVPEAHLLHVKTQCSKAVNHKLIAPLVVRCQRRYTNQFSGKCGCAGKCEVR